MSGPFATPKTKLEWALWHAHRGCFVFQLVENEKIPIEKGFPEKATRDEGSIRRWWTDRPNANIAIYTGRFGNGDESLLVVDIDVKDGKDGFHTLEELACFDYILSPTWRIRTTTGGEHAVYISKKRYKGKVSMYRKDSGLDSRGDRNYIVAEGSTLDGVMYTSVNDLPLAYVDDWLAQEHTESGTVPLFSEEECNQLPPDFNMDRAKARTVQHFKDTKPAALGQRNDQLYGLMSDARGFGVLMPFAIEAYEEHVNQRNGHPLDSDEVYKTARSVYRNRKRVIADKSIDAEFPTYEPAPGETLAQVLNPFDKINAEFAYAIVGGESRILRETTDSNGHETTEHLTFQTLRDLRASDKMMKGNREVLLVDEWRGWAGRRSFDGIVFDPQHGKEVRTVINGKEKTYFNEWRGFAVAPNPVGGAHLAVGLFLEHIRLNICRGNEELYRWLLGFIAHLFQRPWEKPRVALVLRGLKGVGKNFFVEVIGYLLGRHFLLTSNKRHLIGHFNSHFERCLLFCLDEAFWSGDKQAESTLKDLITGTDHFIERKGHEPYRVANKMRVFIIGNEDRLVPATPDERRYAVFDVGDHRRNDRPYFNKIDAAMKNGGYEALLHYLLDYDFSGIDVNSAPLTSGLLDQKILGLEPWVQYWFDCLRDGQIAGLEFEGWPSSIDCKRFQGAMRRALDGRNIKGWIPSDESIGRKMKTLGLRRDKQRVRRGDRSPGESEFKHVYHIPELHEARRRFDELTGQPTQWEPEA